jgi:hypothetical protein
MDSGTNRAEYDFLGTVVPSCSFDVGGGTVKAEGEPVRGNESMLEL